MAKTWTHKCTSVQKFLYPYDIKLHTQQTEPSYHVMVTGNTQQSEKRSMWAYRHEVHKCMQKHQYHISCGLHFQTQGFTSNCHQQSITNAKHYIRTNIFLNKGIITSRKYDFCRCLSATYTKQNTSLSFLMQIINMDHFDKYCT